MVPPRVASEFGLVVRGEDLEFLNGVDIRLIMQRAVGAGIHIGDAVHREVLRRDVVAVDVDAADGVGRRHVAVAALVSMTPGTSFRYPNRSRPLSVMSFNCLPSMVCDFSELANWMGVASAVIAIVSVVLPKRQSQLADVARFLRGQDDSFLRDALETSNRDRTR